MSITDNFVVNSWTGEPEHRMCEVQTGATLLGMGLRHPEGCFLLTCKKHRENRNRSITQSKYYLTRNEGEFTDSESGELGQTAVVSRLVEQTTGTTGLVPAKITQEMGQGIGRERGIDRQIGHHAGCSEAAVGQRMDREGSRAWDTPLSETAKGETCRETTERP